MRMGSPPLPLVVLVVVAGDLDALVASVQALIDSLVVALSIDAVQIE